MGGSWGTGRVADVSAGRVVGGGSALGLGRRRRRRGGLELWTIFMVFVSVVSTGVVYRGFDESERELVIFGATWF